MAYYPKHYITTNLYTNGGEFQYLSNSIEYIGYYWKTGNNRYFTGKTPQDKSQQEIILISTTEYNQNSLYFQDNPTNTKKVTLATSGDGEVNVNINEIIINDYLIAVGATTNIYKTRYLPSYNPQTPTQDDYQIGEMRRYFAKKSNEFIYIEISKEIYDKLQKQDPEITWELYVSFNIPWSISGNKEQVAKTNKNIVDLTIFNNKFYRFNDYLKNDYLKYYQFPNISNLYTSGSEFKTANGQNYIGFYHIHDKTGPMVGATHTKEPHGLLFPINETIVSQIINQQTPQVTTQTTSSYNPPQILTGGGGFSGGGGY